MELHVTLLLIAGLLILVSLVQRLAARVALPASVLLAVIGVAIGTAAALVSHFSAGSGLGEFADVFVKLPVSSEAILYIFLPILLFQSALEIEVRQMLEEAAPILLLAVVAVIVATLVIGVALAPMAGVPIVACWMLGAIVATTDPVAVIGIFRDVGAPSRLTRLVEGESLLNDAAAIALFAVLARIIISGGSASVGTVAVTFLWEFAGGMLLGFLGARLVVALVAWLPDLRMAQVTLTLALPYVVFIIGERALGVSGVVSAVAAGLVMSAMGQARMSPNDWHFLHELWDQLAFWASSLIFLLASLLVPHLLSDAGWMDLLLLLTLIVAALVARAIVLWGLMPALSAMRLSQRVGNGFKTVILWGGLRGAVTLALALAVTENDKLPADVKRFIAVMATGFVFFTLLVQGTTLRWLIRLLGLDRLSSFDQVWRSQVLTLSRERVAEAVQKTGRRYQFPEDRVAEIVERVDPEMASGETVSAQINRPAILSFTDEDRLRLGLVALAAHERELVLEHFASRTVSTRIVDDLLADVGRLLDRTRTKGPAEYMEAAHALVGFPWRFRLALFMHRRFHSDRWLVDQLADRFESLLVIRIVLDELGPYVDDALAPLIGKRLTPRIREILQQRRQAADAAFEALVAQYPAYAELLERRFLNMVALRRQDLEYRTLVEGRLIGPELYGSLRKELLAAREKARVRPRLDLGLETRALISHVPLFKDLSKPQLDALAHLLRPRFAVPGERLITTGDRGDAMYFISSGVVQVQAGDQKIPLTRGDFFGEMALVWDLPRQADVTASSYCQLLVLQDDDFQALLRGHRDMKTIIDREAAARRAMNEQANKE
jgi:CPA1 family monovalent cation:H+ antiporter